MRREGGNRPRLGVGDITIDGRAVVMRAVPIELTAREYSIMSDGAIGARSSRAQQYASTFTVRRRRVSNVIDVTSPPPPQAGTAFTRTQRSRLYVMRESLRYRLTVVRPGAPRCSVVRGAVVYRMETMMPARCRLMRTRAGDGEMKPVEAGRVDLDLPPTLPLPSRGEVGPISHLGAAGDRSIRSRFTRRAARQHRGGTPRKNGSSGRRRDRARRPRHRRFAAGRMGTVPERSACRRCDPPRCDLRRVVRGWPGPRPNQENQPDSACDVGGRLNARIALRYRQRARNKWPRR